MRDYLRKDILKTLTATNADESRVSITRECVNGYHKVPVENIYGATTLVGLMYRVYDPSVKSYNYILHVGITTQNKEVECMENEYEKAYYNAVTDPQVVYNIGEDLYGFNWNDFSSAIIKIQPKNYYAWRETNNITCLLKKIGLLK